MGYNPGIDCCTKSGIPICTVGVKVWSIPALHTSKATCGSFSANNALLRTRGGSQADVWLDYCCRRRCKDSYFGAFVPAVKLFPVATPYAAPAGYRLDFSDPLLTVAKGEIFFVFLFDCFCRRRHACCAFDVRRTHTKGSRAPALAGSRWVCRTRSEHVGLQVYSLVWLFVMLQMCASGNQTTRRRTGRRQNTRREVVAGDEDILSQVARRLRRRLILLLNGRACLYIPSSPDPHTHLGSSMDSDAESCRDLAPSFWSGGYGLARGLVCLLFAELPLIYCPGWDGPPATQPCSPAFACFKQPWMGTLLLARFADRSRWRCRLYKHCSK